MKVVLFGGSGMVGQGVLRACVEGSNVESVLTVVRREMQAPAAKVKVLVRQDFFDWHGAEVEFAGYDACFFCLGRSAVGMKEPEYRHDTYELTLGVAAMLRQAGVKTFVYVSGAGTNATGGAMWARVKGETENALLAMGFEQAYMFRPGFIQPMHGIRSKTRLYQALYDVLGWTYPLLRRVARRFVTNTEEVGRAMVSVGLHGYPKPVLEMTDIQDAAAQI